MFTVYDLNKYFTHTTVTSLTLDLETWSKVTEHHLPEGTLGVKYKPDLDKGRLITTCSDR